jgi:hypothetical protein
MGVCLVQRITIRQCRTPVYNPDAP